MSIAVYVETGDKRVFACAIDWPGWCRSGKTEAQALETLEAYRPRYERVAEKAGLSLGRADFEVVHRRGGSGGTDFGVPGAVGEGDTDRLTPAAARRLAALVSAAWECLDAIVARAPAELRKGPRGGGRDRDKIVAHVLGADAGYAHQIGLKFSEPAIDDRAAITAMRAAILAVLTAAEDPQPPNVKRPWPRRYAARRIAWHALDHAWEIEDRTD